MRLVQPHRTGLITIIAGMSALLAAAPALAARDNTSRQMKCSLPYPTVRMVERPIPRPDHHAGARNGAGNLSASYKFICISY